MVGAVVELAAVAGHDAPRAAIPGAGRLHRVLAVVAERTLRQALLSVAERRAVLLVRKRAIVLDQLEGLASLHRQVFRMDFLRKTKSRKENDGQKRNEEPQA